MAYQLDPAVIAEARKAFAAADVDYVLDKLRNTPLPLDRGGPPPRIHVAVIWLSGGDRAELDRHLGMAARDWRDVLVAGGLADSDWKQALLQRGIACDRW